MPISSRVSVGKPSLPTCAGTSKIEHDLCPGPRAPGRCRKSSLDARLPDPEATAAPQATKLAAGILAPRCGTLCVGLPIDHNGLRPYATVALATAKPPCVRHSRTPERVR